MCKLQLRKLYASVYVQGHLSDDHDDGDGDDYHGDVNEEEGDDHDEDVESALNQICIQRYLIITRMTMIKMRKMILMNDDGKFHNEDHDYEDF